MPSSKVVAIAAEKAKGRREKAADLYNALEIALKEPPKSNEIRGSLKSLIHTYFSSMEEFRAFAAKRKQKVGSG